MPHIYNQPPYNDDYDRSKGYVGILAVPGRAEQAREFTQVGTMMTDFIGRLGDSVYSNGAIIEGCTLVVHEKKAILSSGRIYLNQLVRLVNGAELNINGTGSEVIGAKIVTSIVTEEQDASLRDPAQGYENYGQAGAHRIKEEVVFTVNDSEASTLYRLEDGEIVNKENSADNTMMTEMLARRTYEENGNYKIKGLELRDRNETREGKILVSLTEGKAYIRGFEIDKPHATSVKVDYSQTTRQILSEPKVYKDNVKDYKLNNQPVKQFTNVVCIVEATDTLTRGNIMGGIDYLPKTPVVEVIEVKQGATTYIKGTDYQLTTDGIDWSLNGKDPSTGSTYTVKYKYNKIMQIGTDIDLYNDGTNDYLRFLDGGAKPVVDSTVSIDYQFYLARKDLVCLNKYGETVVVPGKPDILRLAESEINQNEDRLVIGIVSVLPNSNKVQISNYNTTRLSQSDLFKMMKRINDIEYNQAITDLDKEAMEGENATNLKGVYTDGFIGLTKCDTTHSEFECTLDIERGELGLPTISSITTLLPNKDSYENQISEIGRVIMAPYVDKEVLSQKHATGRMLVNPYSVFNPMCLVDINPSVDNWIDSEKITVHEQTTKSLTLSRWWYHQGEPWAEDMRQQWINAGFADGGESLEWDSGTATTTSTSSKVILDEAIMYMRQRVVTVSGANFNKSDDNLICLFNDTTIPLTPVAPTVAGTVTGSVRTDAKGKFKATFTVPPNIPCGSVEVLIRNANSAGKTTYRAQGRKIVTQETVLTTTNVVTPVDPLAQSFGFSEDTTLTKVGLYFAQKSETQSVVVQVRNMVNGYPGTTCYAAVTVDADQVKVSEKGTVATEVNFPQPIYCKADTQYCVCILSDSDAYSMFVAELGQKDLLTGEFVTSQPYGAGVLFSSSNALTWTPHQTMDLKFDLYKAEFTGKGQIIFEEVSELNISRIVLAAQALDYQNQGIEWFYRLGANGSWLPLRTYTERTFSSTASKIALKAVINALGNTSPIIASDCINLAGFIEKSRGAYVSRTVTMDETFTNARVALEISMPSGTSVRVFIKTDNNANWVQLTDTPSVTPVDQEFSRYEWNKTGINSKNYKVKIELETSNPIIKPRVRKLMSILKY